jgi:hypothetical protein
MPYPSLEQVRLDFKAAKKALRDAGMPSKLVGSIEAKALRAGRKQYRPVKTRRRVAQARLGQEARRWRTIVSACIAIIRPEEYKRRVLL